MAHHDQNRADAWAHQQGCYGPVHRVEDMWGGYWQTKSDWGVYNFRLPDAEPPDSPCQSYEWHTLADKKWHHIIPGEDNVWYIDGILFTHPNTEVRNDGA